MAVHEELATDPQCDHKDSRPRDFPWTNVLRDDSYPRAGTPSEIGTGWAGSAASWSKEVRRYTSSMRSCPTFQTWYIVQPALTSQRSLWSRQTFSCTGPSTASITSRNEMSLAGRASW